MKKLFQASMTMIALMAALPLFAQQKDIKLPPEATEFWEPVPRKVTPATQMGQAPSDAIVIFDGKNLDNFVSAKDGSAPQ